MIYYNLLYCIVYFSPVLIENDLTINAIRTHTASNCGEREGVEGV